MRWRSSRPPSPLLRRWFPARLRARIAGLQTGGRTATTVEGSVQNTPLAIFVGMRELGITLGYGLRSDRVVAVLRARLGGVAK